MRQLLQKNMNKARLDSIPEYEHIPSFAQMVEELSSLKPEDWAHVEFGRELLAYRISKEQENTLSAAALKCGREYAEKMRQEYGRLGIREIARKASVSVTFGETASTEMRIVFAEFRRPSEILLSRQVIDRTSEFIKRSDATGYFRGMDLQSAVLAHELFHWIEENEPAIFTRNANVVIPLMRVWKRRVRLQCWSEIAAMEFSRALCGDEGSPYLYVLAALYACNGNLANKYYLKVKELVGKRKENEKND